MDEYITLDAHRIASGIFCKQRITLENFILESRYLHYFRSFRDYYIGYVKDVVYTYTKLLVYTINHGLEELTKKLISNMSNRYNPDEVLCKVVDAVSDSALMSELGIFVISKFYSTYKMNLWQKLICERLPVALYYLDAGINPEINLENLPLESPNIGAYLEKVTVKSDNVGALLITYINRNSAIPLFPLLSRAFSFGTIMNNMHKIYDTLYYYDTYNVNPAMTKRLAVCIMEIKQRKKQILEKYTSD